MFYSFKIPFFNIWLHKYIFHYLQKIKLWKVCCVVLWKTSSNFTSDVLFLHHAVKFHSGGYKIINIIILPLLFLGTILILGSGIKNTSFTIREIFPEVVLLDFRGFFDVALFDPHISFIVRFVVGVVKLELPVASVADTDDSPAPTLRSLL